MTQEDIAKATGLSVYTVKRMETVGTQRSTVANVLVVQKPLEAAGVIFIPENGGGAGGRLARPRDHK
ncbi:MAG: transcriptional regulator [Delftia acidovorans]|nr:MAG: transcriptional regulator [Delftia acidovorans]